MLKHRQSGRTRARSRISMSISSKTVAYVTSMERDYRGHAANERLSHRRAVPGDPHDAQTPAVRLQWGVWALECALALALRAIFSAPPAQKLSISCAKLTRSLSIQSKGGPAKVRCRPLRYLFAPVPLACRTSRATTIPRRYQQSRLCDGRRVRADGFLHVNTSAQRLGNRQPSPTPLWSWCLFDQHRCARR